MTSSSSSEDVTGYGSTGWRGWGSGLGEQFLGRVPMPLTSFTICIVGGELGGVLGLRLELGTLGTFGAGSLLVCLPTGGGEGLNRFSSSSSIGVSLPGAGLFGFFLIVVGPLPLD